jgi:hypothetical protein
MGTKPTDDQYNDEETIARAEAALKRMLATPPKHHSAMKLGKRKEKAKERPASKGRVHKGKTRV